MCRDLHILRTLHKCVENLHLESSKDSGFKMPLIFILVQGIKSCDTPDLTNNMDPKKNNIRSCNVTLKALIS